MIKDKYYTTVEAGLLVGFTPDHIRKLILDGKVKAEKIGKTWVIKQKDVKLIKRKRRNKRMISNGISA